MDWYLAELSDLDNFKPLIEITLHLELTRYRDVYISDLAIRRSLMISKRAKVCGVR